MNIDFYSYSGLGGRPVNEDSYIAGNGYFVVSDGLGGHDNGELASGAAIRYIAENFVSSDISNEHISNLLIGADEAVKQSGEGGKATVAAVFTDGDMIRIDNIGDSRVYYFRHGSIFFRTKDHSVCQASVDMGEMNDIDVRNSADRSGLFKVLGDDTVLKLPKPYDIIDPINGDAFLICSDGFWENVYEAEMEADFLKAENARDWLTHMLKRHFLRAQNNGDNFTAICGIIHSPKTFPRTLSATNASHVAEIPRTAEIVGFSQNEHSPAMPFKNKLIIIACAVIAAAAISTAMLLISINKSNGESSDNNSAIASTDASENSESMSSSESPASSESSDTSENPDASDVPSTPENQGKPQFPGASALPIFPGIPSVSQL